MSVDLTPRQTDIVELLAAGMSNPQIAQKLFLSPHTVKRHVAAVLHRLGAATRQQAALVWIAETMPQCPNCGQAQWEAGAAAEARSAQCPGRRTAPEDVPLPAILLWAPEESDD